MLAKLLNRTIRYETVVAPLREITAQLEALSVQNMNRIDINKVEIAELQEENAELINEAAQARTTQQRIAALLK
jgi:FtsZ-binding cell division protein ZapB